MGDQQMRVGLGQFNEMTDEVLRFAAQLGVTTIQMNSPRLPGDVRWMASDVRGLVERAESFGLTLEAIENTPPQFFLKAMLGQDGADEQIANYQATIRAVGEAGVPILGYNFMPNSVWRTSGVTAGRGGVKVTSFDQGIVDAAGGDGREFTPAKGHWGPGIWTTDDPQEIVSADQMWANYERFIQAVLPVAKEAGVKLALHPDDPPVPMLGGVARIFHEPAGFKRAEEIAIATGAVEAWGLDLCLGCCSEMPGGADNVREMIEHFGPTGRILYVHFRDVQGTVPVFQECFLGEGNWDPAEVIQLLHDNGFTGFLLDDHVPHMDDDTSWNHRGRAHAVGYMQGLLNIIERAKAA